tara:strand:- start:2378 stop:2875 length:498 start_codon:yes stop_codon:yes gene_type:complete
MKQDNLKIQPDTDNIVELMYDTPKTGVNTYGNWYLYGVKLKDGQETAIFATETLHGRLENYGRGDVVNIRKEDIGNGRFAWNIIPQEGTGFKKSASNQEHTIDGRTHDIHKQVCLKLAVDRMSSSDKAFTTGELIIIEANMKSLLGVLEGTNKEDREESTEENPF